MFRSSFAAAVCEVNSGKSEQSVWCVCCVCGVCDNECVSTEAGAGKPRRRHGNKVTDGGCLEWLSASGGGDGGGVMH